MDNLTTKMTQMEISMHNVQASNKYLEQLVNNIIIQCKNISIPLFY